MTPTGEPTRLAVTLGDPRGIGPEIVPVALRTVLDERSDCSFVVVGDEASVRAIPPDIARRTDTLARESIGTFDEALEGSLESAGECSVAALRRAVDLALEGEVSGVVTGPVHKPALHAAGATFPGQTEFLRHLTDSPVVGMLMDSERPDRGGPVRVLLATTHLALRDVPARLTRATVEAQTELLDRSLRAGWGIEAPRIALCALNPHASDGGLFGDEEARVLIPAVESLRESGIDISGPHPADTVFIRMVRGEVDAVVVPYHDVGMAVFKTLTFGRGVNVTLGLPFVRTSPDHGTAFDLAGTGRADPTSMVEAIRLALMVSATRRHAAL